MDTVRITTVVQEMGVTKDYALRLAKKMGLELHYGARRAASLLRADADRLVNEYQPRQSSRGSSDKDIGFDGFGYFYVIQLVPEENPNRIKIGYTDNLDQRLADHRTTNPTLTLVKSWPCKRAWEQAATAGVTREGCQRIGGEVFEGEVQGFKDRAEAFFALMPTVNRA